MRAIGKWAAAGLAMIAGAATAGTPVVNATPPTESFVGEQFCFNAALTNADPSETGYAPYYRVFLEPDLTLASASFVGSNLTINNEGVFPAAPGNTLTDSITDEDVTGNEGATLYTIEFPIGSVTSGSPPLSMELCVDVDTNAVENVPQTDAIGITPAFSLGDTPTGANGPQTGPRSEFDFTPRIVTYELTDMTAEGERPPGPAWQFDIEACADIASTRTVAPLDFNTISPIVLPNNVQFVGPITFSGTGTGCAAATNPADLTAAPGGEIDIDCASGQGQLGNDAEVCATFPVYITDTLDPTQCTNDGAINTAKHVAIQKGNSGATLPGGTRNYTFNIQVSEFVPGIARLETTDTLPDGLTFNDDATVSLNGGGAVALTGVLRTISNNTPGTGQTTVVFDLTAALGTIPAAATVVVNYSTSIDQTFDATGSPVLARDTLANTVTAEYDIDGAGNATNCSDGSNSSFTIDDIDIQKTLVSPGGGVVQPGDPVTFRLRMDIPSGDVNGIIFDDFFPLPVFDSTTINTNTDLGTNPDISYGPGDTLGLTPISITPTAADNSLRIIWPDVTTSSPQVIEIDITAVVSDDPFADNLVLSNLYQAETDNTPADAATSLSTTAIRVRAPTLTLTKTADTTTNLQAGDTVNYAITATNGSTAGAFDVIVTDDEPAGLTGCAFVNATGGSGTGGDSPFDGDGFLFTSFDGPNTDRLDGGASVTVNVSCTVAADVTPEQEILNTAGVTWASQSGATPFPQEIAEESVETEPQANPAKSIVATSESATPESSPRPLVQGEVVRFRMSVAIPEGQQTNVNLIDLIPAGLQFLDDGTADIAFVSTNPGAITASGFNNGNCVSGSLEQTGALAGITPNCELPAFGGTFNSGTDVTLALGTVQNTETDADEEFILIELNAVSVGDQDNNQTRGNRFRLDSDQATVTSPNSQVRFVEPILETTKTPSPTTADAGDTITYTIRVEHDGDSLADAFDIEFTDTLDGGQLENFTFVNGPAAPAGGGTCTAGSATVDSSDPFGAGITITFEILPQGEVCEIVYTADLQTGVIPGNTVDNTGNVDYDTLTGTGDSGNTTGSPQGTQGSFSADDTASVMITSASNSKTVDSTSFTHTPEGGDGTTTGTPRILSIGETVRYRLEIGLPEGNAPSFEITDAMPDGLQYVVGSARLAFLSDGAGITPTPAIVCANGGTVDISGDENDLATAEPNCEIAANGGPFASGTDPAFDLGDVMNDDSDASQEFVILEYDALVLNDVANQQGTDLNNSFTLSIDGNPAGSAAGAFTEVAEPQLVCAINIAPNPVDNRTDPTPTVTYTYTLTNNGGATAFQAGAAGGGGWVLDLPAGLENIAALNVVPTGDVFLNNTATPVTAGDFAVSGADNNILTAGAGLQIADGASLAVSFDVTLQAGVAPGDSLADACVIAYSGQATGGAGDGVRDSSNVATGSGNDPITDTGALNDYRNETSVTLNTIAENPEIGVAKAITTGPTNNGDGTYSLTYAIVVENSGDVGLENIVLTEPLATTFAGATFAIDNISVVSDSTSLVLDPGFTGAAPNDVVLDAGASTLPAGEQGTVTIEIAVTPGANLGPYNNSATIAADSDRTGTTVNDVSDVGADPDGNGNGDPTDDGDPTPVTFAEAPELGLAKALTAGPTNNGDGSYSLTYRFVVENSGDVLLNDVQVDESLATVFAGTTFTVDNLASTDFTVNGAFDGDTTTGLLAPSNTLAAGDSGEIDLAITVTPGANLGQFDNTAEASGTSPSGATPTDTSTDGTDPDGNSNGDPTDDNDTTPVVLAENAEIGLAKQVVGAPVNNGDGTYSLRYRLFVENTGDVALSGVQIDDDLGTVFADATAFSVDNIESTDLTVNAGGFTGSAPNIGVLAGTDTLAAGASGEVFLDVTIEPGADLGPYANTATASGDSPGSTTATDISDNSNVTDENGVNGPGDDSDPTPISFVEGPRIGVAKAVAGTPVNNGDGTYSLTYSIVVENAGDVALSEVSVTESLATVFADADAVVVDSLTSTDFTVNTPGFDGDADSELLAAGNTLEVGAQGTITLALTITPGADLGPYDNTVTASGTSPSNAVFTDDSVDGIDPDADNDSDPNNDQSPTSTTFSEDAEIGVAKAITNGPVNNGDGSYTLTYRITVENSGDVDLADVQVDEPLATTFAGATFTVDALIGTGVTVAAGVFDGDANPSVLVAGNTLAAGTSGTVDLTVTVTPGGNLGPYNNTATASGTAPSGATPSDTSTDGTTPDGNGDGDPTNDDTPTTTTFSEDAEIGVAKAVTAGPTNNGDGTYSLTYTITVENSGDVALSDVQIDEPLAATFAGASFVIDSLTSTDLAVASGVFDGAGNTGLLAPGVELAASASGTIELSLTVTPGANLGPYNNTATASGTSPSGAMPSDTSADGVVPDANNDGDPGNDDTPTPVSFDEDAEIGVAKSVTDGPTNNGDGSYSLTYQIIVQNSGDVALADVQVDEPLATAFAGATFTVDALSATGGLTVAAGVFDGAANPGLLTAGNSLTPGASASIDLTITVTPGGNLGPYDNQVTASGTSPSGATPVDTSVDGNTPDANGDGDPTNDDSPTTSGFSETPSLGAAKSATDAVPNFDNTFTSTITIRVVNNGDVVINDVSVDEPLAANFAPATVVGVENLAVVGDIAATRPDFDGVAVTNLVADGQSLPAGGEAIFTFDVIVNLDTGAQCAAIPLSNTVTAEGTSPAGALVADQSVPGNDPDPDNDGDPGNNAAPTSIAFVTGVDGVLTITPEILPSEPISVSVADADDNRDAAVIETITVLVTNGTTGEQETLTLTETGANSGVFEGALDTVESDVRGTDQDGTLNTAFESTYSVTFIDTLSESGCVNTITATGEVAGLATLVGNAWLDANADGGFDAGERPLEGWIIEVRDANGVVVATVPVAADGSYTVPDLIPGDGYSVTLVHPDTGTTFGQLGDITLPPNVTVLDQNLPVNPGGIVYDAVNRVPVPGTTLRLVNSAGDVLPDACLLPGQQNQVTADDGLYQFDILLGADPACPSGETYTIQFDAPDGFQTGVSELIPPDGGVFDPTGLGDPALVSATGAVPVGNAPTDYFTQLALEDNDPAVVFNHIPLDPVGVETSSVRLTKRVAQPTTTIGSLVAYTITVENLSPVLLPGIEVADSLPPGFSFVENSATLDGQRTGFTVTGPRPVRFDGIALEPGQLRTLRYILRVGAGVTAGDYVNTAAPTLNGLTIGNEDTAMVEVIADPDFEETTIIGKVWHDRDGDGWQDSADATGLVLSGGPFGRGREIDRIAGRDSEGDNLERHEVVFTVPNSTATLTLTSAEGSVVVLEPDGSLLTDHSGDVARGRNSQSLRIVREPLFDEGETISRTMTRTETVVENSIVEPVRFASGKADIPPSYIEQLRAVLASLEDQRNVRLTFVGHTDNQRLSARTAAIYTDNQGLSESRAQTVARYIQEALELPDSAIESSGRADREPVATNATQAGMALNRRVEIGVIYERDEPVEEVVHELRAPAPTGQMRVRVINDGLQEPGIAGVRLATVEGLVIETDAQGRYHIAAVDGGFLERGRNFIVKVDPATLPRDSEFTTENPRVKRITQGLLNQFDFGVRMPRFRTSAPTLRTFEFTPAFFEADSDKVQDRFQPLLAELTDALEEAGGGRVVVLSDSGAAAKALAARRGAALMAVLRERLPMEIWRNTEVFVMASNEQSRVRQQTPNALRRAGALLLGLVINTAHASDCVLESCSVDGALVAQSEPLEWFDPQTDAPLMHPTDGRFRINLPGGGVIWATEDSGDMQARLSVAGPRHFPTAGTDAPMTFIAYSNYAAFIDKYELQIFNDADADRTAPLATLSPVNTTDAFTSFVRFEWTPPNGVFAPGMQLAYRLVATGNALRDRTQDALIRVVTADEYAELTTKAAERFAKRKEDRPVPVRPFAAAPELPAHEAHRLLVATYGRSQLARQNILLHGARVRLQGHDFPESHSIYVNDQWLPIDVDGKFAGEYLLPIGDAWARVAVAMDGGDVWLKDIPVTVTGEHRFLVALADFTAASNDLSGSLEPLSANDRYAEDSLVEGRLAYYLKAKIQGKYLLTSQLDSREEQLDDILGNLDQRDPRSLFRRIDPDRYYPVYGDDSTTINDTNTQGRLYVRFEWNKSEVIWGNFQTEIDDSEFIQYRRTLYGGQLDWRSVATTDHDETRTRVSVFGSEAQTVLGHSEFVGTGGSLYYLRHLDIVPGSEQVRIQFRDIDTNRVVDVVDLLRGRDYEVDELQGRLILSEPLLQIAQQSAPSIIRDGPLDGNLAILVADYEYLPAGFDADQIAAGIRGKHWLGDNVSVGGSYVSEGRGDEDYTLAGVDVAITDGRGTYLKVEAASSEATQAERFFSTDGGLSFGALNNVTSANRSGEALGVETRINLQNRGITSAPSTVAAWWRRTDDQFSIARRDDGVDIYEQGLEWLYDWSDRGRLALRATTVERETQSEQTDITLQVANGIGESGTLSGEVRGLSQTSLQPGGQSVDATLAALRYAHRIGSRAEVYATGQFTIDNDGGDYDNNDLASLGMTYAITEQTSLLAEVSNGHRGDGATLTMSHDVSADHTVYGTFTHSTDQTDTPLGGLPATGNGRDRLLPGNTLAIGHRSRVSNQLDVFNETTAADVRGPVSLGHVFGLNWNVQGGFRMGLTLQRSDVNAEFGVVEREAVTVSGGYRSSSFNWTSRVELRDDQAAFADDSVRQWASINRLDWKLSESFRLLTRFNYADTEDDGDFRDDTKLVEGGVGLAYRPVDNNRTNWLAKYTYLYDLTSSAQADLFGALGSRTDQRSSIFSFEGVHRFGPKWSLGGKVAQRISELRLDRSTGDWFDSTTNFAALRVRYHLISNWDAMAEYRWLEVQEAESARRGWLVGVDRHVGDHMKIGIGYNFTDFSDDLTQLDYEFEGFFLNVLGKY